MQDSFKNPFRPGAGQKPPHLAGREEETAVLSKLLDQEEVFKNLILTGLRGTGKTVLAETWTPIALSKGWLWVGTDLSESASVSEERLATRLLTDLSVVTSSIVVGSEEIENVGFRNATNDRVDAYMDYNMLVAYFNSQPGLVSDKLKSTLEWVWSFMKLDISVSGIVFAYDEAQNMSDKSQDNQYPLSMMLDVFQSLQRKSIPFFILLVGLPTLFPKLVAARTYSERMFDVVELKSLTPQESREAILKPIEKEACPVSFEEGLVQSIIEQSGGYPYFIQFICREIYDYYLGELSRGVDNKIISLKSIVSKLDTVFFAGRWNNITDRQRELMSVISKLPNCNQEFSIQDVVNKSKELLEKPFGNSQMNQMFVRLEEEGLMHKTRHGKYTLGIPLLGEFIKRQNLL